MEALLQFILDNIIIVVIIFGFLTSLFTKGKKNQGPEMPTFGGGDRTRSAGRGSLNQDERDREPRSTARPTPAVSQPVRREVYESKFDIPAQAGEGKSMLSQQQQPSPFQAAQRPMSPVIQQHTIRDEESPIYHPLVKGDLREKAAEGMMWSEVFGKPRAYRKHSR